MGLMLLPFLIVGYFFKRMIWSYVIKKKSFIEWSILILSITIIIVSISALIHGDFKPSKESARDMNIKHGKK